MLDVRRMHAATRVEACEIGNMASGERQRESCVPRSCCGCADAVCVLITLKVLFAQSDTRRSSKANASHQTV